MRRLFILAVLIALVAGGVSLLWAPNLSSSLTDRAVRIVGLVWPDAAGRLRQAGREPLSARLERKGLRLGAPAFIRIFKEESQLEVWIKRSGQFELFESYPICQWSGDLGPKVREGDGQSPEGFYAVGAKQLNPNSAYHLAFNLGFPNAYDRAKGRTGSFLMVHGDCVSIGCYAMGDAAIEDIYGIVSTAIQGGQGEVPVHAFPFRLSDDRVEAMRDHRWSGEWRGLKVGYDLFEANRRPPQVTVCNGGYRFDAAVDPECTPVAGW